jgi:hypothetical protein
MKKDLSKKNDKKLPIKKKKINNSIFSKERESELLQRLVEYCR